MPGWGRRSAQDAIAETGAGMTRFRTGPHLASWAGRAPLDHQSGTRKGQAKSKKGNRYLAGLLGETAVAVGRTQTRESARYRRLARRRGTAKACVAVGNTQLKASNCWLIPACATPTSARTTTNAAPTPAARSPTTSAISATSASKSPSAAAPNPNPPGQETPQRPDPHRPDRPRPARWPGSAAARPANLHFSGRQSLGAGRRWASAAC